ncbi:hypothetical protein DM860_003601 [Cuscuta australis]|uniref:Uncharacterized protein n=1 Tax=Cuscuta australis TaxID=267555 RepID=A0A328DGB8_9ASTE|nr:hypothetical protein DM860_003601 [Cuscuta australis]
MSKKKATMTLRDFHGGSIPSDLPLPSAPGVSARPLDRQMYWGTNAGRIDQKLRPGSAGASRNFDEKALFLNHSAHIGRNFEEDERKPLDGMPGAPRRMISDESIYAQPSRVEPKSRPVSAPLSQTSSSSSGSSYASRFSEVNNIRNPQTSSGTSRVNTSSTNAWGLGKEAMSIKESSATTGWSTLDTASKLVHASALDKISSGRWNSKQHMSFPTETKESYYRGDGMYDRNACSVTEVVDEMHLRNKNLVIHAERNLAIGNGIHSNMELPSQERVHSPISIESLEKRPSINVHGFQKSHGADKFNESEPRSSVACESSERPKLKLLPRSKPLENNAPAVLGHQHSDPIRLEYGGDMTGSSNLPKNDLAGDVGGDRVERPKLNLKPRSQTPEQLNESEGKRSTVFGGARPREVVLKARGFDHAGDHDHQPLSRDKQDATAHHTTRYNTERADNTVIAKDNYSNNNRTVNTDSRRDPRSDVHRRNRQSENPRNNSSSEERPPSPETWRRKPANDPPSYSGDAPGGVRFGKVASAVELATAFSRPVSDPLSLTDRFSGQRNLPPTARPFSRLMGPPARPQAQINSY